MAVWVNARVKHVTDWTDSLFSLTVTLHDPLRGQYAKMAGNDGERGSAAYSFVECASNENREFYLPRAEGKTPRAALQPGDEVMIPRSSGFFVLDE